MDNLVILLYEPQNDLNIGSILRTAANFGISDIRIVGNRPIDPDVVTVTATHAADRLAGISLFSTLYEAVDDCHFVFATSSRPRHADEVLLSPTEAALKTNQALSSHRRVAFLFGREDHGLPNNALDAATSLVVIPTTDSYRSLNLAHAVQLIAWECYRLSLNATQSAPASPTPAPRGQVERMLTRCRETLDLVNFFKYGDGEHVMRSIRNTFAKAELTPRELSIWFGVFSEIIYFIQHRLPQPPDDPPAAK